MTKSKKSKMRTGKKESLCKMFGVLAAPNSGFN